MQKVGDEEELQKNDNQGNIENEKSSLGETKAFFQFF